jgi:uncharacterized membrane protein
VAHRAAIVVPSMAVVSVSGLAGPIASAESNLSLTSPLVWVMIGISVAGAIVTFAFLVYAVWKFRDPRVRGRRYG